MNPRWIWVVGGLVLMAVGLVTYRRRTTARLVAMMAILVAAAAILLGLFPENLLCMVPDRMRLSMAVVSLAMLYVTLEAIRRRHLRERYALLWIAVSMGFFGLATYPDAILFLSNAMGMHYTSALLVTVFTFMLMVSFHVCLVLSRADEDKRRMSQAIALLQMRIERLEQERKEPGGQELPAPSHDGTG
jgi:hypothetical protein